MPHVQVRCTILTSGTLAPLDSFAQELHLGPAVTLENPHVIQPEQAWVGVVPTGPQGHALNSCYENRDSRAYKEDLGNALCNFARQVRPCPCWHAAMHGPAGSGCSICQDSLCTVHPDTVTWDDSINFEQWHGASACLCS